MKVAGRATIEAPGGFTYPPTVADEMVGKSFTYAPGTDTPMTGVVIAATVRDDGSGIELDIEFDL